MISASIPMPALATNQRSFAAPSPILRIAPGADAVQEVAGRLDRVVRHAEGAGEDVAAAARHGGQQRHVRARSVDQHAVDDLVDDAVAAEGHDHVEPLLEGSLAEQDAVPPVGGHGDVEVELVGQGMNDDVDDAG